MRRVVGHLAEADPAVDDGRPDRRVRVIGVGAVDDPEIASGHPHIVRRALVGPRDVGRRRPRGARVVGRGHVEQQRSRGTAPAALADLGRQAGERPAGAELGQLEAEGLAGVGASQEEHAGGDDAAIRGVPHGGHDRLAEHLAALDDGASPVGPGHAREDEVARSGAVQHVDEVGGVAPGGEPA